VLLLKKANFRSTFVSSKIAFRPFLLNVSPSSVFPLHVSAVFFDTRVLDLLLKGISGYFVFET
jgi:hypothetical protein